MTHVKAERERDVAQKLGNSISGSSCLRRRLYRMPKMSKKMFNMLWWMDCNDREPTRTKKVQSRGRREGIESYSACSPQDELHANWNRMMKKVPWALSIHNFIHLINSIHSNYEQRIMNMCGSCAHLSSKMKKQKVQIKVQHREKIRSLKFFNLNFSPLHFHFTRAHTSMELLN